MAVTVIRPAAPGDDPLVQGLLHALFLEERSRGYAPDLDAAWPLTGEALQYIARRVSLEGLALLATIDSGVVGSLLAGPRPSSSSDVVGLESLYVVPSARRNGVGLALLEAFVVWRRKAGFRLASVAVAPQNLAAVNLYVRAGFRPSTLILEDRTDSCEA